MISNALGRWFGAKPGDATGLFPQSHILRRRAQSLEKLLARDAVRYLCVGGVCALVNWGAMLLIDDKRYLASSLVLFVPLATMSFLLHARWTFRRDPSLRTWVAYMIGMLPGSTVSLGILSALSEVVGLPLAIAIPATTAIMVGCNFLVSKLTIVGLARPASSP